MGELINGRMPEEIKHVTEWACFSCGGLECDECEYRDACTIENRDRAVPDALALIERLEAERDAALAKVPKWISVKERLPESGVHVFVLCEIRANGGVIRRYVCDGFHVEAWKEKAGRYSEDCALAYNDEDDEYYLEEGWYEVIKNWEEYDSVTIDDFVTHWMPLPEPPRGDV